MSRFFAWVVSGCLLSACGGSGPPPASPDPAPAAKAETPPNPDSSAPAAEPDVAEPAEDPAAESTPRAKDAAKWLHDMTTIEGIDLEQRGVLSLNGLSEEQFGLPAPLRKAMEVATSPGFDPSQQNRILVAGLEEGAPDVVKELCGKPIDELMKEVIAAPEPTRAKLVIDQCKLAGVVDTANVPKDSFAYPLVSAVVQKLFRAEGGHSKAELELAKLIAVARRPVH